jgi:hypothetical protein
MTNDEETDQPLIADHRNFYKVEKGSRDRERVTSSLDKAKPASAASRKWKAPAIGGQG